MRRIISLLLTIILVLSLLSGCAKQESISQETTVETTAEVAEEVIVKEENTEISLESIAKLNGCSVDELNVVFDNDGYPSFIGNKISEDVITNEEEAYQMLLSMSKLLGLDDIGLIYLSTNYSPITNTTYYAYNQVSKEDLGEGFERSVEFYNTTIKIGVDKDGHPDCISSYLHREIPKVSNAKIITKEQAAATIRDKNPNIHVFDDESMLTYWVDGTSSAVSEGSKLSLVWVVYADSADSTECEQYDAYIVSAIDKGDGTGEVLSQFGVSSVGEYNDADDESDINTAVHCFDDMEDVGEYTYEIDFKWMSDVDQEYSKNYVGADTMKVTVPVMKNKKDGLYYLGNKEHHIFMTNQTDMFLSNGYFNNLNPYICDDPEKLSNWHFKKDTYEQTGQKYFDDPDYVISSFAEYVHTIRLFGEKFDLFNQYPDDCYLLCTYATNVPLQYPDSLRDFVYNAANAGQLFDWTMFYTSPQLALCLDPVIMSHEFTHGVNMHFSNFRYMNEQGALMEGYADIIGYYITAIDSEKEDDWYIGGTYAPAFRNMKNPMDSKLLTKQPKYKQGVMYVSDIDEEMMQSLYLDFGGVHTNSGVPNHFAYQLTNGNANADEELLTKEDNLYVWYETLFLGNYDSDFSDQRAYLEYAAKKYGLNDKKIKYMNRILSEYGFEDGIVDEKLLNSEDSKEATVSIDYDNDEDKDTYKCGAIFLSIGEDGSLVDTAVLGGFASDFTQVKKLPKEVDWNGLYFFVSTQDGVNTEAIMKIDTSITNTINVSGKIMKADDDYILSKEYTILNVKIPETISTDKDGDGNTVITAKEPNSVLLITQKEGAKEGEYEALVLTFESLEEDKKE